MALSVSTAGLFVFLLPGLFLRTFIYQDSLVKRAVFSANGLYAALSVIGLALCVHAAALGGLGLLTALTGSDGLFLDLGQDTVSLIEGALARPWLPAGYLLYAMVVALGLAKCVALAARRGGFTARLLHGPLAALQGAGGPGMITCFVLTNIAHENRQIIYSGFPEEIGLKDGSKIDYLVLRAPEKFYLRKDRRWPDTTLKQARTISRPYGRGVLFIAGGQIENVHFESWSF